MVSDHALKLAIRERLERYNRNAVRADLPPMSYTQMRARVLSGMHLSLEEMTPLRQEQVAAGAAALESGRDLIICGSTGSGKTTIAQAVNNRTKGGLYIAGSYLEYGKELQGSNHLEWGEELSGSTYLEWDSEEPKVRRVREASALCIDEVMGHKELGISLLAADKPLAVVVHAMKPSDARLRLEYIGLERDWNDPVILFCRYEDRLNDEQRQELWDREDRELLEKRSIPAIVNG